MLDNIRFVLINTFHPGNVGAAARAMKTMGVTQLYLVNPRNYPSPDAESRAAGALDVLQQAVIVDTFEEAIADCALVVGTSARLRSNPWPMLSAESCAKKAVDEASKQQVAIVFGRERMGLHNDELQKCNYHVSIPANPEYPVLNIASAIQIVAYEIYKYSVELTGDANPKATAGTKRTYANSKEMELFYNQLDQLLIRIGFTLPQNPGKTMLHLKRMINRARPEVKEMRMLRGIVSQLEKLSGK